MRPDVPAVHAGGTDDLVQLDPDHPGFRDRAYRERRNRIARLALEYRSGDEPPTAPYSEEEHGVWRAIWRELAPLHQRFGSREYLRSDERVRLNRERIPQLAEVNAAIDGSGFGMLPVAGLVSARRFLEYLGRGIFLSTQYIRHHSRPLYTPEPDVVHELVGHAATFVHPVYAKLNRAFGEAALGADDRRMLALERTYWYTLEFGVVREGDELRAYGAGLLSGAGELARFGAREGLELRPIDLAAMGALPYDPTGYQPVLFVAESWRDLDALADQLRGS
jgi:phenylalanine-4-hydroxylase